MIEVDHLSKRYGPVTAVDDVSFRVESGQILGFLGPNGAGKTTTLKLLMGMLRPTSGTARIFGDPIADPETRRRVGFLPEQAYFYDYLTARELVAYFGQLSGLTADEAPARAETVLERVALPPAALMASAAAAVS